VIHVSAPKGNLYQKAHELGHVDDALKMRKYTDKLLGKDVNFYPAYDFLTGPAESFLKSTFPSVEKAISGFKATNPQAYDMLSFASGRASIPGLAGAALGASQTVRDAVRTVLPFEGTDKVMDFVEEHPIGTSVAGFLPQLINEAYTSVPGYKLISKFYEHINDMDPSKITPDIKAALGGLAGRIGKISPEMEGMKFLGHNALASLTYAMAPLTAAAIAYINSSNDKKE
jgi:hypothetical protein